MQIISALHRSRLPRQKRMEQPSAICIAAPLVVLMRVAFLAVISSRAAYFKSTFSWLIFPSNLNGARSK